MKKIIGSIAASFALSFLVYACSCSCGKAISPLGNIITQEYPVSPFDKISVSDAFHLEITQGSQSSVIITADEAFMPFMVCEVSGNTLKLHYDEDVEFEKNYTIQVKVSVPALKAISATGASKIKTIGAFTAQELKVSSTGASKWEANFETSKIKIDASGASTFNLKGKSAICELNFSGASTFNGLDFATENCTIKSSGASIFKVQASQTINVSASGASNIVYTGGGKLQMGRFAGSSTIEELR